MECELLQNYNDAWNQAKFQALFPLAVFWSRNWVSAMPLLVSETPPPNGLLVKSLLMISRIKMQQK